MLNGFTARLPLVPRARSNAVDVFRGLALIMIAWDHLSLGWAQAFTLHNVAWCDAAEVFVFLGGYASASAFAVLLDRQGEHQACARFRRRSWDIYGAFLRLAAWMVGLGLVFWTLGWTTNAMDADVHALITHPWSTLFSVAIAQRQPYVSAILAMYAVFALATPGWLWLRERFPWALLALSVAMWAGSTWFGSLLPSVDGTGWAFNPFAWQLLFVLGLFAQAWPARWEAMPSSSVGRRLGWSVMGVAVVLVVGFALDRRLWHTGALPGVLKQNLAWERLLNIVAWVATMFAVLHIPVARRTVERCTWVARLGRHSLSCFMVGASTSLMLNTLLLHAMQTHGWDQDHLPVVERLLADGVVLTVLLGWATWKDRPSVNHRRRTCLARV